MPARQRTVTNQLRLWQWFVKQRFRAAGGELTRPQLSPDKNQNGNPTPRVAVLVFQSSAGGKSALVMLRTKL
jgi:hypothetical protein